MCVCVCVCARARTRARACHQRKQQQEAGASIRRRQRREGDAGGRHLPPRARARAHTHHTQSHTSHRASQAGGRLRDRREAAPPRAAGRRGRGSGGSPRSRSPVRGPRAHTGPETASQTLVGAHAHPLPSPSASPPAASRPDDGSLQIPGLRAPHTAHHAKPGRTEPRRARERARRAYGAEPSRAGRAAPCRALRGVPRRPPAPAPGHEPLRGSPLSPRPAPRPRTRRRLPGSRIPPQVGLRSPRLWLRDSPAPRSRDFPPL